MAAHATTDDWAGSHCEVTNLSSTCEALGNNHYRCTVKSEHLFTCYNNTGHDQDDIKVEHNQTVQWWDEPNNRWVNLDVPFRFEKGFNVDEDDSYNHHDWLADEGHPWKRSMVVEIGDDLAYRLYAYTDLRLTGDNLHDEKTVAIPQPQA